MAIRMHSAALVLLTALMASACSDEDDQGYADSGVDVDDDSDDEDTGADNDACELLTCDDIECGDYDDGCGGMLRCGSCESTASESSSDFVTFATANIGRSSFARTRLSIEQVKGSVSDQSTPKLIGWQEISGGFECGLSESHPCERNFIRDNFPANGSWNHFWLGNDQTHLQVPISLKGMGETIKTRKVLAHKSAGAYGTTGSPTRQITVAYSPEQNISFLNTHFISAAWSCTKSADDRAKRRVAWHEGWANAKALVAEERSRGRNVVFTADLNRSQSPNPCNPTFNAANSLNSKAGIADATRVAGGGLDYIIAIPAPGYRWRYQRRTDGSVKRGRLSNSPMEGFHPGYWVEGRFLKKQ